MKCGNCGKRSSHIKVIDGYEFCHLCGQFSEAGGTDTDGLLTRNRFSVRRDSVMHEGDTLPPHVYDKHERKVKPREDFIKRFPDRIGETFCRKELDDAGYKGLKTKKVCPLEDKVEHQGDQNKRIKELI